MREVITWETGSEEWYCVDSGRPVREGAGDRCLSHGARSVPCMTAVRDPRCRHEHLSPNHPYPHCSECGADGSVLIHPLVPDAVAHARCPFCCQSNDGRRIAVLNGSYVRHLTGAGMVCSGSSVFLGALHPLPEVTTR